MNAQPPPGYDAHDDSPEARSFRAAAAQEAVGELVMAVDPATMATTFVLLIETVDTDGRRAFWSLASDGIPAWQSVGMLQHAVHLEQAATIQEPDASD